MEWPPIVRLMAREPLVSRSHDRRSRLVTTLPKRSMRTTTPRSTPSSRFRARQVEHLEVGDRASEGRELNAALGQPSGGRREPIAAFERAADRRPRVAALGQLDHLLWRCLEKDGRQHAVVRRDEPPITGLGDNPTALGPDARIDDDQENRAGRKVLIGRRQLQRRGPNVVRRQFVGDVDQGDVAARLSTTPFMTPA